MTKVYLQFGWVILFSLFCFMLFEKGMSKNKEDYLKLSQQKFELLMEKERALEEKKELELQINSESDPTWIELVLMQKLGLIREEETKVFFN